MLGLVFPIVIHGARQLQSSVVAVVEQRGVSMMSRARGTDVALCSMYPKSHFDANLTFYHQSLLSSVGLERLTVIVNCHQKVLCSTQREEIFFCCFVWLSHEEAIHFFVYHVHNLDGLGDLLIAERDE
jgi:hypothetical protein